MIATIAAVLVSPFLIGFLLWLRHCRWAWTTLPPDEAERAVRVAGQWFLLRRGPVPHNGARRPFRSDVH